MKLILCLLVFAVRVFAQPFVPDCFIVATATSTTAVNSSNFDNRIGPNTPGLGCVDWTVVYYATSTVSALTVELDSANDTAGTPGAFANFAGTLVAGLNPNTALNEGSAQLTGYFPWERIRISGVTGSGIVITAFAFGFRPIAFTLPKAATTASNITQLGGFSVSACISQTFFNFPGSSSGNFTVIAANGSNRTIICHYDTSFASGLDFKLTTGTTANCASGTADLTGLKKNILADVEDYGPFAPLIAPASQAVCGNISANVVGTINVNYIQIP